MRTAVNREIEAALIATGLPYEIKHGGKHLKVYLAGAFILSLCRKPGPRRDSKQAIAAIKRRVRELECCMADKTS